MNNSSCPICHLATLSPITHSFKDEYLFLFCSNCSHTQVQYSGLKNEHPYFLTGKTRTIRSSFRELSSKLEKRFHLKADDVVLDIGANDATFLRTFDISGLIRVGFEKDSHYADEAKTGIEYFANRPFSARTFEALIGRKARIITAQHVLETEKEPLTFLREVENSLSDDGVFLCEFYSTNDLLKNIENAFSLEPYRQFFSLYSMKIVLEKAGFAIFDIEKILVGGHAIRFYCRKQKSYVENENSEEELGQLLLEEKAILNSLNFEKSFSFFLEQKKELHKFLKECKQNGRKLWLYGLDQKSFPLLTLLEIKQDDIAGLCDTEQNNEGIKNIFPDLPCVDSRGLEAYHPDFLLVLPYAFINEFYQKEADLRRSGTKFVLPLPQFRVIS